MPIPPNGSSSLDEYEITRTFRAATGDIIVSETTASYIKKSDGKRYREFGVDVYWVNDAGQDLSQAHLGDRRALRAAAPASAGTEMTDRVAGKGRSSPARPAASAGPARSASPQEGADIALLDIGARCADRALSRRAAGQLDGDGGSGRSARAPIAALAWPTLPTSAVIATERFKRSASWGGIDIAGGRRGNRFLGQCLGADRGAVAARCSTSISPASGGPPRPSHPP